MATKYIFAALALVFLALALTGSLRGVGSQTRTWLLIGAIFAVVSGYLFYQAT